MGNILGELKLGKNLEKIISEMDVGEVAYTLPENLEFDHDFNGYLNLLGTAFEKKDKRLMHTLYVERIGPGKNDYLVDISKVKKYKWEREEFPHGEDLEEINGLMHDVPIANIGKIEKEKTIDEQIKIAIQNQDYELAERLRNGKK